MRVKLTYTFSAAGTMAPMFVSVLGLTEREMPEDQCITLKIQGLCVGGCVNVGDKQHGWLVFMRNDISSDKIRYHIYRDEVFLPFVRNTRSDFCGWIEGTPIPETLQAVSWCDGDLPQIENIVSDDSLQIYEDNLITENKKNSARSGTEQAADLTRTFKMMHKLQRTHTVSNLPYQRHPMKCMIHNALRRLFYDKRLSLKPTKKNEIIDFISFVPAMTTKAAIYDNINCGFKENGMIDRKTNRYPDFNNILATCRMNPTKEEYALCVNSFSYLFDICQKKGHVADDVFESLGFPMDRDVDGASIRRDATITQEPRQRAKCLTHHHQISQRNNQLMLIEDEIKRKEADHQSQIQQQLDDNKECEKRLCKFMGKNQYKDIYIFNVTHEALEKCNANELGSFICVRKTDLPKSNLPKKGKISDAIKGENNLNSMAYGCRQMPNITKEKVNNNKKNYELNNEIIQLKRHEIEINTNENILKSKKPSQLLTNPIWVTAVWELFGDSSMKEEYDKVSDSILEKSDKLVKIMTTRLTNHIHQRISNEKKQEHWCLHWTSRNMGHVVAIMQLLDHFKPDIDCLDNNATLLAKSGNFKIVNEENLEKEWAYLYFDSNNNSFIRSGKVTGRGFIVCHK